MYHFSMLQASLLMSEGVNTILYIADAVFFLTASIWASHRTLKKRRSSTSTMAGSAVLPTGEFALHVGQSLQDSLVGPSYHSLRYDFKPASVNTEAPGSLTFGIDGQVNLVLCR